MKFRTSRKCNHDANWSIRWRRSEKSGCVVCHPLQSTRKWKIRWWLSKSRSGLNKKRKSKDDFNLDIRTISKARRRHTFLYIIQNAKFYPSQRGETDLRKGKLVMHYTRQVVNLKGNDEPVFLAYQLSLIPNNAINLPHLLDLDPNLRVRNPKKRILELETYFQNEWETSTSELVQIPAFGFLFVEVAEGHLRASATVNYLFALFMNVERLPMQAGLGLSVQINKNYLDLKSCWRTQWEFRAR